MLRQLLIARHAEAGWEGNPATDHERKLSAFGRTQARGLAELLAANNWQPQRVICSSAVRTTRTAAIIHQHLRVAVPILSEQTLYHGGLGALWQVLDQLEDSVSGVLVVGHNPAMSHIATRLGGRDIAMQTASCAIVTASAPSWEEAAEASWTLQELLRPNNQLS